MRSRPHPIPARRSTPGVQSGREAMPRKRPAFTPSHRGRGVQKPKCLKKLLSLWEKEIKHLGTESSSPERRRESKSPRTEPLSLRERGWGEGGGRMGLFRCRYVLLEIAQCLPASRYHSIRLRFVSRHHGSNSAQPASPTHQGRVSGEHPRPLCAGNHQVRSPVFVQYSKNPQYTAGWGVAAGISSRSSGLSAGDTTITVLHRSLSAASVWHV